MTLPAAYARLHADATTRLTDLHLPHLCDQDRLRTQFLAHLRAHPDAMWRDGPSDHFTASALVFDRTGSRVVLVLHRKAGLWLQPGGHFEPQDGDVVSAALREVHEETGVAAEPVPGLMQLDRHDLNSEFGRCTSHLDVRTVAVASRDALTVSDESADVRWWNIDQLPTLIDPHLPAVFRTVREHARAAGAFAQRVISRPAQ